MKTKLAAYITAAVLIGFAVMMLPLALETASPTFQLSPQGSTGERQDQLRNAYGLASPTSLISLTSSSLILLIGLMIAFAAYILVKKQVNPPPAFSYWYKPF